MSLDDELRKRLKDAADRAGAGANPAALRPNPASASGAVLPMKLLAGLGALGLFVGGALGLTALKPDEDNTGIGVTVEAQQYSLYDCPGGAPTGIAYPGDRVYVTGRDESGGWLEVRDPRNQGSTLWVPLGAVDPDTVIDVPTRSCNKPIELIAVGVTPTTTTLVGDTTTSTSLPVATTTPPATLPSDTQKPVAIKATRGNSPIHEASYAVNGCAITSALTVQASDNVGVTQVSGTYGGGLSSSPLSFVHGAGNLWTATFGPFTGISYPYDQNIVISIVARDAAGNQSNAATVSVQVTAECLI